MSTRAFYLGSGDRTAFALYDPPGAASKQRAAAVLLCPLFGNDELCSYRARRAWALSLAGAGHAVLRVDLPGTGDSAGGPRDPGLLDAWVECLARAAEWLKVEREGARLAVVGVDMGGLLAYRAAAAGAAIDDLALWSVPSRGRTLVRRHRAFGQMEAPQEPAEQSESTDDGSVATAGFLLSAETVGALEAIDLAALELPEAPARRVLLLQRDGLDVDARLLSALDRAGAQTEVCAGPGYGEMVAPPQESYAPLEVFATVERWLARADAEGVPRRVSTASGSSDHHCADRLQLTVEGTAVQERPVTIPFEDSRLFGILSEPVDPSHPVELCAVLLNAGAIRHIGPARLWVEIARRWAARGVPTLRVDFAGIGDAEGALAAMRDAGDFYVDRARQESLAVLASLAEHGLPERIVLGGLCSGAYWSLYVGAQDERVEGAYLVNPRVLVWSEDLVGIRDARNLRKALKPGTWRKLLRGEITGERVHDIATGAAISLRRSTVRRGELASQGAVLDEVLREARATATEVLMVFGEDEPLLEEIERDGTLEQLIERQNVRVARIPRPSSHTLEPLPAQRAVHLALDEALTRRLSL